MKQTHSLHCHHNRHFIINLSLTILICLVAAGIQPASAAPPTVYYYVDTTIDSNEPELRVCDSDMSEVNCSLRGAISNARVGSTSVTHLIYIPADIYVLTLAGSGENNNATGDLDVSSRNIIMQGEGIDETVITQSGTSDRIIDHSGVDALTILDLTVSGGGLGTSSGGGSGIRSTSGSLILENVRITGNGFTDLPSSDEDIGGGLLVYNTVLYMTGSNIDENEANQGAGMAIYNSYDGPTATIKTSTIHNNYTYVGTSAGNGGGIWAGEYSRLDLENVTIAKNYADPGDGGGIYFYDNAAAKLNHVTLYENWASHYGHAIAGGYSVHLDVYNSVLYWRFGGYVCHYPAGTALDIFSNGRNITNETGEDHCKLGSFPGIDPVLGELGYYNSVLQVVPLLAGSPAIDYALPTDPLVTADQRGVLRRIDGDGDGIVEPDAGAYEVGMNFFLPIIQGP